MLSDHLKTLRDIPFLRTVASKLDLPCWTDDRQDSNRLCLRSVFPYGTSALEDDTLYVHGRDKDIRRPYSLYWKNDRGARALALWMIRTYTRYSGLEVCSKCIFKGFRQGEIVIHLSQLSCERCKTPLREGILMGMDVRGKNPSSAEGKYFRATIWSWGPVLGIARSANEIYGLEMNMKNWDANDGMGLDTQEECNRLADAMEGCLTLEGETISSPDLPVASVIKKAFGGINTPPIKKTHAEKFIVFLRHCGGFEIC